MYNYFPSHFSKIIVMRQFFPKLLHVATFTKLLLYIIWPDLLLCGKFIRTIAVMFLIIFRGNIFDKNRPNRSQFFHGGFVGQSNNELISRVNNWSKIETNFETCYYEIGFISKYLGCKSRSNQIL